MTIGVRKLESLGYQWRCLRDPAFSRFDTIPVVLKRWFWSVILIGQERSRDIISILGHTPDHAPDHLAYQTKV